MKRMMLVVCVALCCHADAIGDEAPAAERIINLNDDFRLIGRSGLPLGHEFRAKFAFVDGLLQLVSVNGTDLKVPLPLRPPPRFDFQPVDPLYNGHNASDDLEEEARRGVEVWAYEVGRMAADVPDANDPDRRVLGFRSRFCVLKAVQEDDAIPPVPQVLPTDVRVDQFSPKTKVMGRLGIELGQWSTIKGIWSNADGWKFRVLEVNGRKFEPSDTQQPGESHTSFELNPADIKPCRFSKEADVRPTQGAIWQFEAYETFGYEGIPDVKHGGAIIRRWRQFGRYTSLRWRNLGVSNAVVTKASSN